MKYLISLLLLLGTVSCRESELLAYLDAIQVFDQQVCTVFNINQQKEYWVTAGHCLYDGPLATYTILQFPATVIRASITDDLAIVQTGGLEIRHLPISFTAPQVHDLLIVPGLLYARKPHLIQVGRVVSPKEVWTSSELLWTSNMILELAHPVAPGMSGSPIINIQGEVIGVFQGFWVTDQYEGLAAVGLASPHEDFLRFVRPYLY